MQLDNASKNKNTYVKLKAENHVLILNKTTLFQTKYLTIPFFIFQKFHYDEQHSPSGTDKSIEDDTMDTSANATYPGDTRGMFPSYGIKQEKPEWKRYKKYTSSDMIAAIDCVETTGISASKASKQFGVPCRTLYDKVQKRKSAMNRSNGNITRPPKKSSGGSSNGGSVAGGGYDNRHAAFPYGLSGTHAAYMSPNDSMERDDMENHQQHLSNLMSNPVAALLDPTFFQKALEARGYDYATAAGREALQAMARAAAEHSVKHHYAHGSPNGHLMDTPPSENRQSPLNDSIKHPDSVTDLSMSAMSNRDPDVPISPPSPPPTNQQIGVIVPAPMSKIMPAAFSEIKREIMVEDDHN